MEHFWHDTWHWGRFTKSEITLMETGKKEEEKDKWSEINVSGGLFHVNKIVYFIYCFLFNY